MIKLCRPAKVSIVVNFFNMQREAKRTLFSLTTNYQHDVRKTDYEVIAIDNGSTKPLDKTWVKSMGDNFRYFYFDSQSPSPCLAVNYAVRKAKYKNVMICIDGARILSPGMIKYMLVGLKMYEHPFVYSLGMHIGWKLQNHLIKEGYNQRAEDELINETYWEKNGYELFNISSLADSSRNGYFSNLKESNCFSMRKKDFIELGGFNEQFSSPGGGLINLDFFNLVNGSKKYAPVMILGEATFHQFHGGVATNVTIENHPFNKMAEEYKEIRNKEYKPNNRLPEYIGSINPDYHSKLIPKMKID